MKKRSTILIMLITVLLYSVCYEGGNSQSKATYQVYFDIYYDFNLLFSTYNADFYIDGEKISTINQGDYYTYLTIGIKLLVATSNHVQQRSMEIQ